MRPALWLRCLFLASGLVAGQPTRYALLGTEVHFGTGITQQPDEILWKHNGDKVVDFNGQEEKIFPPYENRITLDWSSADLNITGLTHEDSGVYTVEVHSQKAGKVLDRRNFKLEVIAKVPKPTISCEVNNSSSSEKQATLQCSAASSQSPSLLKFEWSSYGKSQPDSKLTIDLGDEHDEKVYNCTVSNRLTKETTAFTAKECYPEGSSSGPVVEIIAVVIVLLILFVLSGAVWMYIKKKACFARKNRDDVENKSGKRNELDIEEPLLSSFAAGRVQRLKDIFESKGKDEDEKTKSHCKPPLLPTKGKVSDSKPSDLPSRVPDGHGTDTQPPPLSPRAPEKPGVEEGADDQLSEPPKDLGCEKETVQSPALLDRQGEDPQSDPHSPTAPKNLEKDTDVDQQINPTEELESEEGHDVSTLAPHSEASQSDQHSHVAAPEKPGRVQSLKNKFQPKGKDEDEKTKSHCKPPLSPTKGKVSDSEPSDLPSRVPDGHGTDTHPPPLSPRAPEKPGVEGGADDQLSEPPKDLGCEKETVESPALLDRQGEDPQSDPHSPTAPKNLEKDTDVDQQINPTEELESEEEHDVSTLASCSEASQSDQHSHVVAPEKPGLVQRRKNIFGPKGKVSDSEPSDLPSRVPDGHGTDTQPPPLSPSTPEKPGVEGGADDQLSEPPKVLGCEKETVESPALLDRQGEDPQSDPHSPTAPKNLEKDTDVDQQINPTEELESEEGHDVSTLAPHSEASQSDQHSHVVAPEKPGLVQRRKNIFGPKGKVSDSEPSDLPSRVPDGHGTDTQPPPLSPSTPEKPGVEGGADDQLSEPPKDLGCEKETVQSPALLDRQEKDTDVDQQINPTEELESEEGHDVSPLAPHSEASQSDQHSHVAAPEKPGLVQRRKNIFEQKGKVSDSEPSDLPSRVPDGHGTDTQPPPLSPSTPEKPDTPTNEESSPAPAAPSCPPGVQTPEKVSPEDSGAQQSDDNSVDVSEETKTETPGLKEGNESDD
ncbi:uncharacterized protein KZ484_014829 isoform 2-T2 [Pholidichthys leucotaenia]